MSAIVWSKNNCTYCEQAKHLLKAKGVDFEVRKVDGVSWTVEDLKEAVPNARTVPQIFINEEYVGGFNELKQYFEKQSV